MDCTAGRHRGLCRCGPDPRDSLRSANSGGAGCRKKCHPGGPTGWWWWPKGAEFVDHPQAQADEASVNPLQASLSPLATGDAGEHVICRSGQAAETVADRLQLLIAEET